MALGRKIKPHSTALNMRKRYPGDLTDKEGNLNRTPFYHRIEQKVEDQQNI
ncbi:hypothetical protein PHSC3_001717 [Chlamydiales bacterium STE3]|nr:hypothetical protein PHSC3_001717 [Chlamydiales bacterium STE3]